MDLFEKCKSLSFRPTPALLLFLLLGMMVFFGIIDVFKLQKLAIEDFNIPSKLNIFPLQSSTENTTALKITVIVFLTNDIKTEMYQRALDSLACYSKIHGYNFVIAMDSDFTKICSHKDIFFRRHCVVAQFLSSCDYLLFLDADMGVVNPKRRIEELIDDRFDVTFYDRFFNAEITAGAYLLKNSAYALDFITGFADFESQLPNSVHGTDNGALQAYVVSKIFPDRKEDYQICLEAWKVSKSNDDLFTYETCIRSMMGIHENFGKIRILRKGTGWARDCWLTNSMWNPEIDFIFHGWKKQKLVNYTNSDLPMKPRVGNTEIWYDPIVGPLNIDQCVSGNVSWSYDHNLIASVSDLKEVMANFKNEVQRKNFNHLARLTTIVH